MKSVMLPLDTPASRLKAEKFWSVVNADHAPVEETLSIGLAEAFDLCNL